MLSTLLPELSPIELTIDRIHRIAKPRHLEEAVPRDVLLRVHFFQAKEQILSRARALRNLPAPYADIQLYADLSQHTLQLRRQLKTVTKALTSHKIVCKWRHPATILVTHNGIPHSVPTIEGGMKLLHSWGIVPEPPHADHASARAPNPFSVGSQRPNEPELSPS